MLKLNAVQVPKKMPTCGQVFKDKSNFKWKKKKGEEKKTTTLCHINRHG